MSKFGNEIHTYNRMLPDTQKFDAAETSQDPDRPTSEIAIEDIDTSAGDLTRLPEDEAKRARVLRGLKAMNEYENDPPQSTRKNEGSTQPLEWKPENPLLEADLQKAAELQAMSSRARFVDKDVADELERKAEQALHEAGMAEMTREQNKFIEEHPVIYRTEQNAIDPTRPDLWTAEQVKKFPDIVYALHQQGHEYKLSSNIPSEKRAVFEEAIARVKAGLYRPDGNEKTKQNAAAVFVAGIARAVGKLRRRRK